MTPENPKRVRGFRRSNFGPSPYTVSTRGKRKGVTSNDTLRAARPDGDRAATKGVVLNDTLGSSAIGLPEVIKLAAHGGDRRSAEAKEQPDQPDNVSLKYGTSKPYALARLTRDRPEHWRQNIVRRHLEAGQRAMVGARLANLKRGGDRRSGAIKGSNDPLKIDDVARLVGVSRDSIKRAKQVLDSGDSEEHRRALDAFDKMAGHPHGGDRRSEGFKASNPVLEKKPAPGSRQEALRRPRKDRPDPHERVVVAGWRA